jgi:hypothetical protein
MRSGPLVVMAAPDDVEVLPWVVVGLVCVLDDVPEGASPARTLVDVEPLVVVVAPLVVNEADGVTAADGVGIGVAAVVVTAADGVGIGVATVVVTAADGVGIGVAAVVDTAADGVGIGVATVVDTAADGVGIGVAAVVVTI